MLFAEIAETSEAVRATRSRNAKIAALASCLERLAPVEAEAGVGFLAGEPRQPKLGIGYATLRDVTPPPGARPPSLTVSDVDIGFERIAAASGPGSAKARREFLKELLAAATESEQRLLRALVVREIRQGALEGVLVEAVARAAGIDAAAVRRAVMLLGDVRPVAAAVLAEGEQALARFRLTLFQPVKPMLAQTADDVAEALNAGSAIVESKLDGARIQVHRDGDRVEVYTRNLRVITSRVPEIVAAVGGLDVESIILDGEAIALGSDGRPLPFQVTMGRFGTEDAGRAAPPLQPFFFDCLYLNGFDLIDRPLSERVDHMGRHLPSAVCVRRIATDDVAAAEQFAQRMLDAGHEGVVVKDPGSGYAAGRRGAAWRKVKPTHTLDLVVLAAEWGSGRRSGWLSNLHLGARDPEGGFVMLGKTFKGLTDDMLAWQTRRLLELERARDGHVVFVEPQLVAEIAFDGVQTSTRYPGGVALRFARVKGYRPDKHPDDADTIDAVRAHLIGRGG